MTQTAAPSERRQSVPVLVGNVKVGGGAPIVVQSMTNTDTADVDGTVKQVAALNRAGSEIVRITVDRDEAAAAVPHIKEKLLKMGINVPLVGDFHYIGHKLLAEHPACAEALDKYRINPGNVGFGKKKDTQFSRDRRDRDQARQAGAHRRELGLARSGAAHQADGREHQPRRTRRTRAQSRARRWCSPRSFPAKRAEEIGLPQRQDHPLGQGLGRAGPDRGLSGARAPLRLRDPPRPHRGRHGLEGHRGVIRRARHPDAAGHRRHHPHLARRPSPAATARSR